MATRLLAAPLHFISRHLVLLGLAGFLTWGYIWRGPLWVELTGESSRSSSPPVLATSPTLPTVEKPRFRPAENPLKSNNVTRVDPAMLLQSARRAYWEGDPAEAESRYRAYQSLRPEDPDGYGELGDLLQSTGRHREARVVFEEAVARLLAAGREEAAQALLRLLHTLDARQDTPSGDGEPPQ